MYRKYSQAKQDEKVSYHKQIARQHSKILLRAGGIVDPVKIFPMRFYYRAKIWLLFLMLHAPI